MAKKEFKGTVIVNDFKVGTKNTKHYKIGDEYTTTNEKSFMNLVKSKIIKK